MDKKIIVLLLVLLAVKILAFPFSGAVVSDEIERQRVSGIALDSGFFPEADLKVVPSPAPLIYPPFADTVLVSASLFSGLSFGLIQKVIAFALFAFFLLAGWLFSKKYLSLNQQMIFLFLAGISPIILKRFSGLVGESIGLFLFVFFLYLFSRGRQKSAGIVLGFLILVHFRSFFTLAAIIGIYLIFSFSAKKKNEFKKGLEIVLVAVPVAIVSFLYYGFDFFLVHSVNNPFVSGGIFTLIDFFSVPVALIFLIGLALNWKKSDLFLNVQIGIPLAVSFLFYAGLRVINQGYRELIFAVPALCILGAIFLSGSLKSKNRLLVYAGALLVLSVPFFAVSLEQFDSVSDYSMAEFFSSSYSDETVLLAGETGYLLHNKGFPVVISPFMESVPDSSQTLSRAFSFFHGKDVSFAQEIGADCILLNNAWFVDESVYEEFSGVYSSPRNIILCKTAP